MGYILFLCVHKFGNVIFGSFRNGLRPKMIEILRYFLKQTSIRFSLYSILKIISARKSGYML